MDEESNFGTVEEAEEGYGGRNQRDEPKPKTTEQGEGKAKKGIEARTKTWSDLVKGLKTDDDFFGQERERIRDNRVVQTNRFGQTE